MYTGRVTMVEAFHERGGVCIDIHRPLNYHPSSLRVFDTRFWNIAAGHFDVAHREYINVYIAYLQHIFYAISPVFICILGIN